MIALFLINFLKVVSVVLSSYKTFICFLSKSIFKENILKKNVKSICILVKKSVSLQHFKVEKNV